MIVSLLMNISSDVFISISIIHLGYYKLGKVNEVNGNNIIITLFCFVVVVIHHIVITFNHFSGKRKKITKNEKKQIFRYILFQSLLLNFLKLYLKFTFIN
jgi:hypothetical protein